VKTSQNASTYISSTLIKFTEGLQQNISNDYGVVNFVTSKNLTINSTMFPCHNIHKLTWTFPDGKTHSQTDHILVGRMRHKCTLCPIIQAEKCYTDCHTYITFRGSKVSQKDYRMWNKSYNFRNTYTVQLKLFHNTCTHI
jgi:hypothetical protein